jgi:hypothetical protein
VVPIAPLWPIWRRADRPRWILPKGCRHRVRDQLAVKGHKPKDYFGIYEVVWFDTFWLDKA